MNSWKTTLCGVLSLVAAGITLVAVPMMDTDPATLPQWGAFGAAITAAMGFFFARDNDKSSEQVGAK